MRAGSELHNTNGLVITPRGLNIACARCAVGAYYAITPNVVKVLLMVLSMDRVAFQLDFVGKQPNTKNVDNTTSEMYHYVFFVHDILSFWLVY